MSESDLESCDPKACPACSHGDAESALCNECEIGAQFATGRVVTWLRFPTTWSNLDDPQPEHDYVRGIIDRTCKLIADHLDEGLPLDDSVPLGAPRNHPEV